MKLKAINTVQVADAKGKVTEHKPGATFTVNEQEGARLIEARHAEKVGADAEELAAATAASTAAGAGSEAGNKDAPAA